MMPTQELDRIFTFQRVVSILVNINLKGRMGSMNFQRRDNTVLPALPLSLQTEITVSDLRHTFTPFYVLFILCIISIKPQRGFQD